MICICSFQCTRQVISTSCSIKDKKRGKLILAHKFCRKLFHETAFDDEDFDITVAKYISISGRGCAWIYGNIHRTRF